MHLLHFGNAAGHFTTLWMGEGLRSKLKMEKEIFGGSQNTLLAGGRYDYLATQFGYNRGESLSSVGWAAGINRLVMILEYLEDLKRINLN